jgi:hypothetical protein
MRKRWNCGGGDTVFLRPGDALRKVPASHRDLVSREIVAAFNDPVACFREASARCPFDEMREYLEILVADEKWELRLHTNGHGSPGAAAFAFKSRKVTPTEISLPEHGAACSGNAVMTTLYQLIGWLSWTTYGGAGGLHQCPHRSLAGYPCPIDVPNADPSMTFVFGDSPCGDMFIYEKSGRAGMLSHETLRIHWVGSATDMINWIFRELRHKRTPEFDYDRWGKDH